MTSGVRYPWLAQAELEERQGEYEDAMRLAVPDGPVEPPAVAVEVQSSKNTVGLDAVNTLVVTGRDRILLRNYRQQPLRCETYYLIVEAETHSGVTDDDGWTEWFDSAGAEHVTVTCVGLAYRIDLTDTQPSKAPHGQSLLNATGFSAGPLDGHHGIRTKRATRAYQRDRAIPCTGVLDSTTLGLLTDEHEKVG